MTEYPESASQMLEAVLASIGEAVVVVEPDGRFIRNCNTAAEQLFGYDREEMIGQKTEMLHIDQEHFNRFGEISKKVLNCGEVFRSEFRMQQKDGTIINTYNTVGPIREDLGWEAGVVSVIRDITEQKEAKISLEKEKNRLQEAQRIGKVGDWYYDVIQNEIIWTPMMYDIYERDPERGAPTYEDLSSYYPDDFEYHEKMIEQAISENIPCSFELKLNTEKGNTKYIHIEGIPRENENGEVIELYGIVKDITKHIKSFHREKQLKQVFYRALDMAPEPILMRREDGSITFMNKSFHKHTGYTKEEVQTIDDWARLALPDFTPATLRQGVNKVFTGKPVLQGGEYTVQTKNGKKRIWKFSATNLGILPGDDQQTAIVMASDVTELRAAEEAHKSKKRELSTLFSNLPGMAYRCLNNRSFTMEFTSAGCKELTGYKPEEIVFDKKVAYRDLIHPDDKEYVWDQVQEAIRKNRHFELEYRLHTRKGEEKWVWERGKALDTTDQDEIMLQGFISDVTNRKKQEQQLEKLLQQKNTLIQEIHHRVKNNMAVISGLLDLQKEQLSDEKSIEAINRSVMRIHTMANVHERLYQEKDLTDIQSREYVENLLELNRDFYSGSNIQITSDIQSFKLNVNQAIPLGLLLNELITNACQHAFPDNQEGIVKTTLQLQDNKIHAEVTDNGRGMDKEINVEDPNSLGFTIINTLKIQLEAELQIDSSDDGTRFHLSFTREEPKGAASNLDDDFS